MPPLANSSRPFPIIFSNTVTHTHNSTHLLHPPPFSYLNLNTMEQNYSKEPRALYLTRISSPLFNLNVHYSVHNSPPPEPNLSELNPDGTTTIFCILILFSHQRPSLPSRFLHSDLQTKFLCVLSFYPRFLFKCKTVIIT
jgi:hypothetical protein